MMRKHSIFPRRGVSAFALLCPLALVTACSDDETALDATDDGATPESTTGATGGMMDDALDTGQPDGTTTDVGTGGETAADTGDGTAEGDAGESGTGDEPPSGSGLCLGASFEGVRARVFGNGVRPAEGTCEAAPGPCGGDPVGTWSVEAWCGDPAINPWATDCPTSTFEIEVVDVSGTRTFDANNAYSQEITTVTDSVLTIDPACLGLSCGELEAQLVADFPTIDCASGGGVCTCELSATRTSTTQGTWELAGGVLGLTAEDGGVETFSICVTDGQMQTWEDVYSAIPTDTPCDSSMECIDELGDAYDGYVCVDGAG